MTDCDCSDKVLTRRTIKSGHNSRIAYQWQCRGCGASSHMVKQVSLSKAEMEGAVPYDEGARERHWEKQRKLWADRRAEQEAARLGEMESRREFYYAYLESEKWAEIRLKALRRDRDLCQGCLERRATQVHHLTYDRLGDELICDLISLCYYCHKRIHGLEVEMAVVGRKG